MITASLTWRPVRRTCLFCAQELQCGWQTVRLLATPALPVKWKFARSSHILVICDGIVTTEVLGWFTDISSCFVDSHLAFTAKRFWICEAPSDVLHRVRNPRVRRHHERFCLKNRIAKRYGEPKSHRLTWHSFFNLLPHITKAFTQA